MTTSRLYLHAGATEISFSDLAAIPAPEPTPSWHPIPHSTYISAIRDSLSVLGASVVTERFAIKPGHTGADKLFGLIEFEHPRLYSSKGGIAGFGFRGSWDKTIAQSGIISFRTFVCDNMAFSGGEAISFHRKNTPGLAADYETTIATAMINFISTANQFIKVLDQLNHVRVPDTREFIDTTACALADEGAVLWQNVPHLRRELMRIDGPGGFFPAERNAGLTTGLVLQAVTEVEKRSLNALSTVDRMQAATNYVTRLADLEYAHS
jgi:hypothetical protein